MIKKFKRLSLALVVLGLSMQVFAYSDSPFCVTIPNQQGGFTVGADALYWRPTSPDSSYAFVNGPVQTVDTTTTAQQFTVKGVNPNYNWGFDLNAAYRIPCTGNDISAEWVHLQQTDSKNILAPDGITSFEFGNSDLTPFGTTTASPWDTGASTQKYRYDHVDLDVGQKVNFGCRFQFHTIAGVRWADIDRQRNSSFFLNPRLLRTSVPGVITLTASEGAAVNDESDFRGIGPQVGFDGRYCLGYGFGLDAGAKFSLLVGRTSITRETFAIVNSVIATPTETTKITTNFLNHVDADNKNRVVPAADINLGLDYTYNFNNCSRSSLVIEAGYKVIHYWGASQFLGGLPTVSPIIGVSVPSKVTDINQDHSVSFDGPYAGIKINV